MATGKPAFSGKIKASLSPRFWEATRRRFPRFSRCAATLDQLVKRCLAKDPDERLANCTRSDVRAEVIAGGGVQADGEQKALLVAIAIACRLDPRRRDVSDCACAFNCLRQRVFAQPTPVQFLVLPPENSYINAAARAVFHDGRQLAL